MMTKETMHQSCVSIFNQKEKIEYEFYFNCQAAFYLDKGLFREIINIVSYKVPNTSLSEGIRVIKRFEDSRGEDITEEIVQKYKTKNTGGDIVHLKIPWRDFGVQIFFYPVN